MRLKSATKRLLTNVKLFGITMVKNEADIIRPFLESAAQWADRIFVYDNGSNDGTWDIVKAMASDVIVPWKTEDIPFNDGLRSRVFNAFRHEAEVGDWWCFRLDADEFYIENPREFLGTVPRAYHIVARRSLEFRLTLEDLEDFEFSGDFSRDRNKLHYVKPELGVENRFFRHRDTVTWSEGGTRSFGGITYPKAILVAHYPWRSPQQIRKRLETKRDFIYRKAVKKRKTTNLAQTQLAEYPERWRNRCHRRADLIYYRDRSEGEKMPLGKTPGDRGLAYAFKRLLILLGLRK